MWLNLYGFPSINPTNPRTNPWNFHKKKLRIGNFEKLSFFESAIFASSSWILGYQGWVEILMITLVYSKNISVHNILLHSVVSAKLLLNLNFWSRLNKKIEDMQKLNLTDSYRFFFWLLHCNLVDPECPDLLYIQDQLYISMVHIYYGFHIFWKDILLRTITQPFHSHPEKWFWGRHLRFF